jgi:hypothetical protein
VVVDQGVALQQTLATEDLIAVGGTAVALHCGHRFSLDVDCVMPRLRECYGEVLERLERWDGWQTNRCNPPVLILGERHGIELGVRQLRRLVPLETTLARGLRVPTLGEMLRIKARLLAERRATRDYVDVAALTRKLGIDAALKSLVTLNACYPMIGRQTAATAVAEACEAQPLDLAQVSLPRYKGLQPPYNEWATVAATVRELGHALIKSELGGRLRDG